MSLVNDMLKDLDARRRESLIGKQRLVPSAGSGRQGFWSNSSVLGVLLVFALTVAAGMGYLLWIDTSDEGSREERRLLRVPGVEMAAVVPAAERSAAPDEAPAASPADELVAELEQRLAELERQNMILARQHAQQVELSGNPRLAAGDPGHAGTSSLTADLVPAIVDAPLVDAPVASHPASHDNRLQRRAVELSLEELDRQQVQAALQQWAAGQQLAALQALDNFVFQYPHAHQSREALAKLLLQQGERDRALQVAEIGLTVAPALPAYKKVKARILFDQGYVSDALHVLNTFVPAVHQDPEYHDLMATAQLADRQYAAALTSYQALLQQDADVGRWWYGMATALQALDRGPEAITAYERATQQGDLSMMLRQRSQQRIHELMSNSSDEADSR